MLMILTVGKVLLSLVMLWGVLQPLALALRYRRQSTANEFCGMMLLTAFLLTLWTGLTVYLLDLT